MAYLFTTIDNKKYHQMLFHYVAFISNKLSRTKPPTATASASLMKAVVFVAETSTTKTKKQFSTGSNASSKKPAT
jgi:hypothetical protein